MRLRVLLLASALLLGASQSPFQAQAEAQAAGTAAPIGWFEIPTKDAAKARKFYQSVFGWSFAPFPAYGYDAWRIRTGTPGLEGALTTQIYTVKNKGVVLFMRVADVETALTRAIALGGTVDKPRTPVPGIGSTVVLLDPDKNAIGLIGPAPRQR